MIQRRAEAAIFLVVMVLFGVGLHKINTNTTDTLQAQENHSSMLAYTICTARNESIVKSNVRWQNEKDAWTAAAVAREAQAKTADPADKKIDLDAAKVYRKVADSITPYTQTDCGAKP